MANILRVRTVFTAVSGAPWYSNMYFDADTPPATALEVVSAVGTFWTAIKLNMQQGVVITVEGTVPVINPANGKITDELSTTQLQSTGGPGVDPLPFATQGLIKWGTANFVNGRRVTGRTFVPGLQEIDNGNGVPQPNILSVMNNAAAGLIGDTGNTFGIWARPFEHPTDPTKNRVGSFHGVTTGVASPKWAVLRSRRD